MLLLQILLASVIVATVVDYLMWLPRSRTYLRTTGNVPTWPGSGFYIAYKMRGRDV